MKASDHSCIPLCTNCHTLGPRAYHRIGRLSFERHHHLDCLELAARLHREYRETRAGAA